MAAFPVGRFRKFVVYLAMSLAGVMLVVDTVKMYVKVDYSDFDVYYKASERMSAGNWKGLYDFNTDGSNPFRYSPLVLPLFRFLSMIPHGWSRMLWFYFQFGCFLVGFWILYRTIRHFRERDDALFIMCVSWLFSLRFVQDSLVVGQTTGVMFLGFNICLNAWFRGEPIAAGFGSFIPAVLKVAPALNIGLLLVRSPRQFGVEVVKTLVALCGLLVVPLIVLSGGWEEFMTLWRAWWTVLVNDSAFFHPAHYGNQSLKGFLWRMFFAGHISRGAADAVLGAVTVAGIVSLLVFWWRRRCDDFRTMGLFFSLGVMAYLLFMPITFKYSMPCLAIPVAFMISGNMGWLDRAVFAAGALTLSLAGYDIVGERVFFALQKASVPLFVMVLITVCLARQAWRMSVKR